MRALLLVTALLLGALVALGCGDDHLPRDGGVGFPDTGMPDEDAGDDDAGIAACSCTVGSHNDLVYLMSDTGELWSWDPTMPADFAFVAGPVCLGMRPYSMAVDASGIAHIVFAGSLAILTIDVNDPGSCEDSGYVRTNPDFGLFGMSFASNSTTDICADLYVHTYDGDGPFEEGPGFGKLGVIDAETMELTEIAEIDYDGGELTGTGDGRLFAFAGADPVKLVEYDRSTGAVLETIPLTGVRKTNASAMAFHSGDIYIFVEAVPEECNTCLETTCPVDYEACRMDDTCIEHLECAISEAGVRDECGGLLSVDMMTCLTTCGDPCFRPPRARVSRVLHFDLDDSDGGGRAVTEVVAQAPIRVVGAASSPCVQTIPF